MIVRPDEAVNASRGSKGVELRFCQFEISSFVGECSKVFGSIESTYSVRRRESGRFIIAKEKENGNLRIGSTNDQRASLVLETSSSCPPQRR